MILVATAPHFLVYGLYASPIAGPQPVWPGSSTALGQGVSISATTELRSDEVGPFRVAQRDVAAAGVELGIVVHGSEMVNWSD